MAIPTYRVLRAIVALVMLFSFATLFVAPSLVASKSAPSLYVTSEETEATVALASGDVLSKGCCDRYQIGASAHSSACGSNCSYFLPDTTVAFSGSNEPFWHGHALSFKAQDQRPDLRPPIV